VLVGLFPPALTERYARFLVGGIRLPYEEAVTAATGWQNYDYWFARYVIPGTPDVFPYWTFLNGDLRPHMMSGPVLLVVAALGLAYYRTPESAVRRRRLLLFGAVPAVGGYLTLVNTWGLPTAAGLVLLAVLFADAHPVTVLPAGLSDRLQPGGSDRRGAVERELARAVAAVGLAVASGALAALVAAPLLARTPENGGVGLLPPRSGMGGLLLVHGAFLGVFALYLLRRRWPESPVDRRLLAGGALGLAGLLAAGVVFDLAAVALFDPLLMAAWWVARREGGYETVLIVAGLGIALVVEFAYAVVWPYDPNAPRWNTVYKAYLQTWELWGVAGGAAVAWLLGDAWPRLRELAVAPGLDRLRAARGELLTVAVVVVLLAGTATFAATTVPQRAGPYTEHGAGAASLDATAYVSTYHGGEAAAIDWLDDREGTPTVVTAPGRNPYQWRNAPSSLTGLPTVAGWEHAAGYHGRTAYRERVRDVEAIYTGNWTATADRLTEHGVRYVYVGPVERERYGDVSFAGLRGVETVHRSGTVRIYAVDHSKLAVRPGDENRQRGRSVEGALRERYCSQPTDRRPGWLPERFCADD
jgi:YYY domain-containing protein